MNDDFGKGAVAIQVEESAMQGCASYLTHGVHWGKSSQYHGTVSYICLIDSAFHIVSSIFKYFPSFLQSPVLGYLLRSILPGEFVFKIIYNADCQ